MVIVINKINEFAFDILFEDRNETLDSLVRENIEGLCWSKNKKYISRVFHAYHID